jgi:Protein of unknown function (DUF2804)
MPRIRGGRPLKSWRYVGLYGADLMACGAQVSIGPARQAFWAVWDRRAGRLHERTRFVRRGRVLVTPDRLRIADGGVVFDVALSGGDAIEVVCPSGREYAWTEKVGGVRGRGSWTVGGDARAVDLRGVVDVSAGYHARAIDWRWCAGVGTAEDGRAVAWNVVTGINDPPRDSERTVWIDGAAQEPGPVSFAPDLSAVAFAEGPELSFAAEATRARTDDLGLVASDHEQPFGTFSGTLPGGVALAEGFGVMERHAARW